MIRTARPNRSSDRHRNAARMEYALSILFALLAGITPVSPQWIERMLGVDPDSGSGALEWVIVLVLGAGALLALLLAARHQRLAHG